VLVWDAPNMDMCLAEIIGRKASPSIRPRMDALAGWFAGRARGGDRVEAAVFANVAPGHETRLAGWVANLRQWGWSVFVKPKQHRADDVDDEMVRHIERHFRQGNLVELVIASHDGKAFVPLIRRFLADDVAVTLLGFRERMSADLLASGAEFVDLEYVPGVFVEPLPRTNLFDLPRGGRWFEAMQPLEGTAAPEPEPEEPPAPAEPVCDLDRGEVVAFIRQAVGEADDRTLSLQAAGDLLRHAFPGFTLEGSGYLSVTDLLEELQLDGDIRISRTETGHLLHQVTAPASVTPTDVHEAGPTGADEADGPDDDVVIDLDALERQGPDPTAVKQPAVTGDRDHGQPEPQASEEQATGKKPADKKGKGAKGKRDKHAPQAGDAAAPSQWPARAASTAATNPIYRMFGYDPSHPD